MWKGLSSKKPKSLECDKGQEKADLVSFLPDRHFLLLCAIPTSAAKTRDSPRPQQARGPLPQHSIAMTAAFCCLPLPRAGRSPFAFPPSEQGGLRGARAEWTLGQPLSTPEWVPFPDGGRQRSADSLPVQMQGCQAGLLTLHMSSLGLNVVFQMASKACPATPPLPSCARSPGLWTGPGHLSPLRTAQAPVPRVSPQLADHVPSFPPAQ